MKFSMMSSKKKGSEKERIVKEMACAIIHRAFLDMKKGDEEALDFLTTNRLNDIIEWCHLDINADYIRKKLKEATPLEKKDKLHC